MEDLPVSLYRADAFLKFFIGNYAIIRGDFGAAQQRSGTDKAP
jgi:hypothetical protein